MEVSLWNSMMASINFTETLVKSFLLVQKNNLRSQHIKQKKKKFTGVCVLE